MNYIVLDLEWNQSHMGQAGEHPRMPFEIIEIGAVRLDKKFNLIDQYSSIIKPRLYKRLQPHIREILNYDEKVLKKGRPFDMVCREFLKWCNNGTDYSFVKQIDKDNIIIKHDICGQEMNRAIVSAFK